MALTLSKDSLNAEKAGQWFDRLQSLQITRRLGLMAMIAVAVAPSALATATNGAERLATGQLAMMKTTEPRNQFPTLISVR